mmetsp:Transcript_53265/g.142546  ORF Transcript_53265/g.142546 Transcript_53265/m.142546 type:complete len:280 (+) Transcript_53265:204-1043(+)
MANRVVGHACSQVRHDGDGRHQEAAVASCDGLGHDGHPSHVGSHDPHGTDLRGGFENRPQGCAIHAVVQCNPQIVGSLVNAFPKVCIVRIDHADEALTSLRIVRPNKRVHALQVDVVGDGDERPRAHLGAQGTHCSRGEQHIAPEELQGVHQHTNLTHVMALVQVAATTEAGDGDTLQRAKQQSTQVPLDGADGESGKIRVPEGHGSSLTVRSLELVGQLPEPTAQDDAHLRGELGHGAADHLNCVCTASHGQKTGPVFNDVLKKGARQLEEKSLSPEA